MSDTTRVVHELKTWPDYWIALERGVKNFEVRRNDRSFQPGDVLVLREWNPHSEEYTGRSLRRRVNFVLRDGVPFGVQEGFAVLGIGPDTTGQTPAEWQWSLEDLKLSPEERERLEVRGALMAIIQEQVPNLRDSSDLEYLASRVIGEWIPRWLAGRTVVELPAQTGDDDGTHYWHLRSEADEVHAFLEDGKPYVSFMYTDAEPDDGEELGLALIAAARVARRLASESSGDGGGQHV